MMRHFRRGMTVIAGIVGIIIIAGIVFSLDTPGRSLAAGLSEEAAGGEPPQVDMAIQQHAALLSADGMTVEATGEEEPNNPHGISDISSGYDINAPVGSTLLDFQLPGTQPGGLTAPLADSSTCTGCHVDHIRDNYNGSMMTNGMRDPLFRAALVIANKDAGFGGDLCIRCHSPNAWLNNRSATPGDPASTDGRLVNAEDLHGISCTACHRMVPTTPIAGEATLDDAERAALTGPFMSGSSAYIIDRNDVRRGPFNIGAAPHAVAQSSFLRSAEMCATCHDIDNPLLTFNAGSGEFELNTLNTPVATTDRLFPLDRSYSEWDASEFANGGVSGLDYPGLKRSTGTENGAITVCQDCHMPMVTSKIANGGVDRTVGKHQWVGANTSWQDGIIQAWDAVPADTRFDATQTAANKALGVDLLSRAADLDIKIVNGQLEVKVTNNTGHKLPTGYGEGRRMWLEVYQFRGPTLVFTSGIMSGVVGPLPEDPFLKKYEIKLGLTEEHAQEIGRPELEGEGFHIILNNKVFKDNRIPPRGFTNAAFEARDMQPVGVTYADGQYWDTTFYPVHPEADAITVRLMYQTASSEYLDFLATEADVVVSDAVRGNTNWGQLVDDLRSPPLNIGKPQVMTASFLFMPRQFVANSGTDAGTCTDSAAPCKTITYALTQATAGGEIRVAAGLYPEEIMITPLIPISLTGGFTLTNWVTPDWTTNRTILDGQHSYRPLTINADGVRVNGFIVRNGNATNSSEAGGLGGGIFIGSVNKVEDAILLNLRLENNVANTDPTASGTGGGLAAEMGNTFDITGLLTLSNITVFSNTASTAGLGSSGGGMSIRAAGNSSLNVEMVNVTVQGNTAGNDFSSGGGGISLNVRDGTARVRQSMILGNHAAKIKTLLGGPSFGGGINVGGGTLLLENVLIAGNDGERGDALWVQPGSGGIGTVNMNYVTIADNYRVAADAAAAIHIEGSPIDLNLANTLISGNPTAFEAANNAQPISLTLSSVLIDNNVNTVSNGTFTTSGTPLRGVAGYVNAAADDYHLTKTSDAIDEGNNQPPLVDLDGEARPKGAASDIGAYEFAPVGLDDQTITFNQLPDKLVTDAPFALNATASSGLPVSFASLTTSVCTLSGNTVTLVATGTCTIRATQAGNASFNPAPPVVRAFAVKSNAKTDQTITFAQPPDRQLGEPSFGLSASASSGLPVSFTSNTPGVCTVSGSTVTLVALGTCAITATQDGNATINPASPVTRSFTVSTQGGSGQSVYLPGIEKS